MATRWVLPAGLPHATQWAAPAGVVNGALAKSAKFPSEPPRRTHEATPQVPSRGSTAPEGASESQRPRAGWTRSRNW